MRVVKAAIGDAVMTFMWIFCASTLGVGTSIISSLLGVGGLAEHFITVSLIFLLLLVFGTIADLLGGASFNATGNVAFYAAGVGDDSLMSAAIRYPAQVFFCLYTYMLMSHSTRTYLFDTTNKQ